MTPLRLWWTSAPFCRKSLSGNHESITYRSAMNRIFRENSGYLSEIPQRLNTHYWVELLSLIARQIASTVDDTWQFSRLKARVATGIGNTFWLKKFGIFVTSERRKLSPTELYFDIRFLTIIRRTLVRKKVLGTPHKAEVLVHCLRHLVSPRSGFQENRRWPSDPYGALFSYSKQRVGCLAHAGSPSLVFREEDH